VPVQVAFKKSNGSIVHRLICLFSPRFAHCEIVINGTGYPISGGLARGVNARSTNTSYNSNDWRFRDTEWSEDTANEYVLANWKVQYDDGGLKAFALPFFSHDPEKMTCVNDVVRCGIVCGDMRLIGRPSWKITPYKLWRILRPRKSSIIS
tara:strand:- start:32648 stop:33100 length:453 start_codon:yes stop_codon:yes gene_type:complete